MVAFDTFFFYTYMLQVCILYYTHYGVTILRIKYTSTFFFFQYVFCLLFCLFAVGYDATNAIFIIKLRNLFIIRINK